jgi:hypothetical protein
MAAGIAAAMQLAIHVQPASRRECNSYTPMQATSEHGQSVEELLKLRNINPRTFLSVCAQS